MARGLAASLLIVAVGAILEFAVTVSPYQHGLNLNTVGMILLIIGAIGALASVAMYGWGSDMHRHRTVVDDGRGNIVRREETYQ
jgi:hypothetical protein